MLTKLHISDILKYYEDSIMRMRTEALIMAATAAIAVPGCGQEFRPDEPVHINALPTALPQKVVKAEAAAVQITSSRKLLQLAVGSGVRIGQNEYLTAGHVVQAPLALADVADCSSVSVEEATRSPIGSMSFGNSSTYVYGTSLSTIKAVGKFDTGSRPVLSRLKNSTTTLSKLDDIALVEAKDTFHEIRKPERLEIDNKPVKPGEKVYMVNYEPAENGISRSPSESSLSISQIRRGLNLPAIFGGIVLGALPNGYMVVLDGLKNYGHIADTYARGGASGGGVFAADGKLVGLSVAGSTTSETVDNLSHELNERIEGIPQDKEVRFTLVQPVTKLIVQKLVKRMAASPNCPTLF